MSGAIPPLPNMPSWRGAQLKHRDNFTVYLSVTETEAGLSSLYLAPVMVEPSQIQ